MDDLGSLFFLVMGAVACLFFCFVVRGEATKRGRSGMAYFWLSFFLTPIIGGIALGLQGPAPGFPKPKPARS